eukprot:Opistho-1_new@98651
MAEEVDPAVLKRTQKALGSIIKKPALTDKLLSKPPFRYLHDVISEYIRATGLLQGLYSAEELVSDNVTSKEAKVAFLQKAIDAVCFMLDEPCSARPTKIVAGQEADRTNEFLQMLAKAHANKCDDADAVKRVTAGEHYGEKSKPSKNGSSKGSKEPEKAERGDKGDRGDKDREKKSSRKEDAKEGRDNKENERGSRREKESERKDDRKEGREKGSSKDDREKDREREREK